jgi:hypothetical protein
MANNKRFIFNVPGVILLVLLVIGLDNSTQAQSVIPDSQKKVSGFLRRISLLK